MAYFTDPPQVIGHVPRTRGHLGKEVTLNCPLVGNPHPICSWEFYICDYETKLDVPSGISYGNNNCSLVVHKLTADYLYKCFICNAKNNLGSNWITVLEIVFTGISYICAKIKKVLSISIPSNR